MEGYNWTATGRREGLLERISAILNLAKQSPDTAVALSTLTDLQEELDNLLIQETSNCYEAIERIGRKLREVVSSAPILAAAEDQYDTQMAREACLRALDTLEQLSAAKSLQTQASAALIELRSLIKQVSEEQISGSKCLLSLMQLQRRFLIDAGVDLSSDATGGP